MSNTDNEGKNESTLAPIDAVRYWADKVEIDIKTVEGSNIALNSMLVASIKSLIGASRDLATLYSGATSTVEKGVTPAQELEAQFDLEFKPIDSASLEDEDISLISDMLAKTNSDGQEVFVGDANFSDKIEAIIFNCIIEYNDINIMRTEGGKLGAYTLYKTKYGLVVIDQEEERLFCSGTTGMAILLNVLPG